MPNCNKIHYSRFDAHKWQCHLLEGHHGPCMEEPQECLPAAGASHCAKEVETKPSNPKDILGSDRANLSLVPSTAIALESTAFLEGALKYGRYNWRIAGVRSSVYFDACLRHLFKWWNGQDCDPSTRVKHLASARASLAIVIDAEACGKLTDDRPPSMDMDAYIGALEEEVKFLKHIFAGKNPKQYTIEDSEEARYE